MIGPTQHPRQGLRGQVKGSGAAATQPSWRVAGVLSEDLEQPSFQQPAHSRVRGERLLVQRTAFQKGCQPLQQSLVLDGHVLQAWSSTARFWV